MTVHYRVLQPFGLDGHPYHRDGELSYLTEFSALQVLALVASGAVEAVGGPIPDVPPPPPPPPAPPAPAPEPQPLYLMEWAGEGEPPPGTWAYFHKHGQPFPEAAVEPAAEEPAPSEGETPRRRRKGGE